MKRYFFPLIIALSYLSLWAGLFYACGFVNQNPRWNDDRTIYEIEMDIAAHDGDWLKVFQVYEAKWASRRFMSGSVLIGTATLAIVGTDFVALYWINILQATFSSFLLYSFLRHLHVPHLLCFLFPSLVLLGVPSEAYLQLMRSEPSCMLLLSVLIWLMPIQIRSTDAKQKIVLTVALFIFAIMTGFMKESFLLCLPPLSLLYLFIKHYTTPTQSWRTSLYSSWKIIAGLCLVFFTLLTIAKLRIVSPQLEVVAPSCTQVISRVITTAINFMRKKDLLITVGSAGLLLLCFWRKEGSLGTAIKSTILLTLPLLLLLFSFLAPHAALHANLALGNGRYWLPFTFSTAFCCIWLCHEGLKRFPRAFLISLALIILYTLVLGWRSYQLGLYFSKERNSNGHFLEYLKQASEPKQNMIFVTGPESVSYETILSTSAGYLRLHGDIGKVTIVGSRIEPAWMNSNLREQHGYSNQIDLRISTEDQKTWNQTGLILIPKTREMDFINANPGLFSPDEWRREEYERISESIFEAILYIRVK